MADIDKPFMERELAALRAEVERQRGRLKAAEDVVSYLVIWGAAPTDRLVELVTESMRLRQRDKETLCAPSAVRAALTREKCAGCGRDLDPVNRGLCPDCEPAHDAAAAAAEFRQDSTADR